MQKGSTLFLKIAIILIGLTVLALCVFALPFGIMSDKTGLYAPILIGMYAPAIPFFIALFEALSILRLVDQNKVFSNKSIRALSSIKYCAIIISALYAVGMPYIFIAADKDDAPGVIAVALVIVFASLMIATAAALFQRLTQNAVDIKAENDLTV